MKSITAIKILGEWDKKGRYVFTIGDLRKIFFQDNKRNFTSSLKRLVKYNILVKTCRSIYVNQNAHCWDGYILEHIAKALRREHYNYIV